MNVLTIEQMKELQALGCNVKKASRAYLVADVKNVIDENTHSALEEFSYDDETAPVEKLSNGYLATRFGKLLIYAFTATDIIKIAMSDKMNELEDAMSAVNTKIKMPAAFIISKLK